MVKFLSLTSISIVERAKKGKLYPKGTVYIQVSACKKGGDEAWKILKEECTLESKFAVAIPTVDLVPEYFQELLNYYTPEWHARYVGKNINISMETFKFLEVGYTDDVHKQKEYADMLKNIDYECEAIEKTINNYKLVKEWYLRKMFI